MKPVSENSTDVRKQRRGNSRRQPKLVERLIKISRVTKVTKGGKKMSFRAVVVIGDENGQVGVGIGKAEDVVNAFKKAKTDGRKNLIKIPITKSFSFIASFWRSFQPKKLSSSANSTALRMALSPPAIIPITIP